jgi:hypothetical protein
MQFVSVAASLLPQESHLSLWLTSEPPSSSMRTHSYDREPFTMALCSGVRPSQSSQLGFPPEEEQLFS